MAIDHDQHRRNRRVSLWMSQAIFDASDRQSKTLSVLLWSRQNAVKLYNSGLLSAHLSILYIGIVMQSIAYISKHVRQSNITTQERTDQMTVKIRPIEEAMKSPFLTLQETANLLGVSSNTIHQWRKRGDFKLPAYRFGNVLRFKREDIEKFIEDSREK